MRILRTNTPTSFQPPQNRLLNPSYCLYMMGQVVESGAASFLVMHPNYDTRDFSSQAPRSCRHPKEVRVDKRSARQSGEDGCAPVHHTSLCHFLVECLHWSESAPFELAVASRRRTLQLDIINRERLVCRPGHLRIASRLVNFRGVFSHIPDTHQVAGALVRSRLHFRGVQRCSTSSVT